MDGVLSVGELLRDRRRELGWSLAGVAGKLDDLGVSISTSQLQRIEQGQVPRADHLAALCRVYGPPEGQLLDLLLVSGDRRVRTKADGTPEALVARGDELLAAGRYDRARAKYVAALAKLRDENLQEKAAIQLRLAWLDGREGFHESAFHRAIRLVENEALSDEVRAPARVLVFRNMVLLGWLVTAEGFATTIENLAAARSVDVGTRAAALAALALWHQARGDRSRAIEIQARAVEMFGRAGAEREKLRVALGLVDLLVEARERRAALSRLRAIERATRKAELRGLRPEVLRRLGTMLAENGRFAEALRVLEEAEDVARDMGRHEPLFRARAWRRRVLLALGEAKSARALEKWLVRHAARHADVPEAREFLEEGPAGAGREETQPPVPPPEGKTATAFRRQGGEA